MTGDDVGNDWYGAVAKACRTFVACYNKINLATETRKRDLGAEQSLASALLEMCDLRKKRPSRQPTKAELKQIEQRTGVQQAVFLAMFGEDPSGKWDRARRKLEIAKNQLAAEQRADNPSVLDELGNIDIGPAIFRIGCALVAGAVIGAPLGALASHESILPKMAEAVAVTTTTAVFAEVYNPLSPRFGRNRPPAEPTTNADASGFLSIMDEILHPDDEPGSMPRPGELLPPEPPRSPWPPDPGPPSGPKGPGGP
jgi:hypothetical protein